MKTIKHLLSIVTLTLGCSSIQRPESSLLEYNPDRIPETHRSDFISVLDAATPPVADATTLLNLPEGSRIIPIREGGISPVNGVVFNTIAAAGLETEIRSQQRVCLVNSQYQQQQLAANAIRDIDTLTNVLNFNQQRYQLVINNRNDTIRKYEAYSTELNARSNGELGRIIGFTIGGVAVGAVVTGLIIGFIPRAP